MSHLIVSVLQGTLDLPDEEDEVLVERIEDKTRMWLPLSVFRGRPEAGQRLHLTIEEIAAGPGTEVFRISEHLAEVHYPEHSFVVGRMGDGFYLQIAYVEPDIETGLPANQRGRKWYVSAHATRGEVVQTALKAALASAEHRVREHFTYQGQRIFGPHFDLDALVELCLQNKVERRG